MAKMAKPRQPETQISTAPSALIAYGANNVGALRNCGIMGAFFDGVEFVGTVRASSL